MKKFARHFFIVYCFAQGLYCEIYKVFTALKTMNEPAADVIICGVLMGIIVFKLFGAGWEHD